MKLLRHGLLALSLLAVSGLAIAGHDHDRKHDRGHDRHGWQDNRGHDRHAPRYRNVERQHDRGHHWARGHRYGRPIYVMQDYRHYRLRPPPHGYGWVRADNNDYLLVALTTGIILDIVTR